MIKKTLDTLRKNPIIIAAYSFIVLVFIGGFALISPYYNKFNSLLFNFYEKYSEYSDKLDSQKMIELIEPQEMIELTKLSVIILIFYLLILAITIVYLPGFGNMLSQAVCNGKTTLKVFFQGIKKYFVKILLASLLLMAIVFGFRITASFLSMFIAALTNADTIIDEQSLYNTQRLMTGIFYIITILSYPLILLWFPSLFMDKNDGVIATLKKGFKAGIRRYKELVLPTAFVLMPSIVVQALNYTDINISLPVYIVLYAYQVIAILFFATYIFELYNDKKKHNYL